MKDTIAVLIPARRMSTRLPEKLLLAETGQALLLHTCARAAEAVGKAHVHVCADDQTLVDIVSQAGYQAYMTDPQHQSGTDRIAEIAATLDNTIIVNVQGDEPEIDPTAITLVAHLLEAHQWAGMATLACPGDASTATDPNQVKVVLAAGQRALYFSRAGIPYDREAQAVSADCYRHIGIYAYRREVLLGYKQLPSSRLEELEKLEQLRALEAGVGIACAVVAESAAGIDVRADYDAFLQRWTTEQSTRAENN